MDGRLFPTESPKNRGLKWMASFSLANLLKIGVKATSLVTPEFRTKYRTNLTYPLGSFSLFEKSVKVCLHRKSYWPPSKFHGLHFEAVEAVEIPP